MTETPTPGQTIGPFFGYSLPYEGGGELVPPYHPGAVRLHGSVLDGLGDPVPDALVEIWQADEQGHVPQVPGSIVRDGHTFTGFGRVPTDATGHFDFSTVEPGPVGGSAPYFSLVIFARGLLDRLFTRVYLPESDRLDADPLLSSLSEGRRQTLIALREEDGSLRFDVHLQGEAETVFLSFAAAPPHSQRSSAG